MPRFEMEKLPAWSSAPERTVQLAASDCEPLLLPELLALADDDCRERWASLSLGYPCNSLGEPALLRELAEGLYGGRLGGGAPESNVLGVIPAEGILLAMHSLLTGEGGEHIVAMAPGYESLSSVARHALRCEVTPWEAQWGSDGHPTFCLGRLESLLRPETKLLVVNVPHNPTGWLPTPSEWQALIALCEERGLWLFSDEMYRHLERPAHPTLPSACTEYRKAVTLGGLSKAWGLAGLRLGWLASRHEGLISRCGELKDYTSICASLITMHD